MRLTLATTFVLILLPAPAKGQSVDALSLQAGVHARIYGPTTYPKYEFITITSVSPDSLRYSLDRGLDTRSIGWQQITKMDASTGSHRNTWLGAGIGLLVGAVVGATLGSNAPGDEFRGIERVLQGILGGAVGGLGGAALGHASRSENWMPVTLPRPAPRAAG